MVSTDIKGILHGKIWFGDVNLRYGLLIHHVTKNILFQSLTDTKIVGSSSRFSPMSVLRVPNQKDLSQAYSQHSLHRSISQLIDRKSLMMDEGSWDNPLGQDSGLVRTDMFVLMYIWWLEWKHIISNYRTGKPLHTFALRSRCNTGKMLLWKLVHVTWHYLIFAYCCKSYCLSGQKDFSKPAYHDLMFCLSVCGGRWDCGHYKGLKFCEKRAHHVHWHSPLRQEPSRWSGVTIATDTLFQTMAVKFISAKQNW